MGEHYNNFSQWKIRDWELLIFNKRKIKTIYFVKLLNKHLFMLPNKYVCNYAFFIKIFVYGSWQFKVPVCKYTQKMERTLIGSLYAVNQEYDVF